MSRSSVLLIDCPDATGLVHNVTGVLVQQGLNIDEQAEFVTPDARFFMRTSVTGDHDHDALEGALRDALPEGAGLRVVDPARPKRLVVLVTREPHCLGDLLIRHAYGELNAEILAVVGNRPRLGDLVGRFDLPFHHVSADSLSREAHEAQVLDVIGRYQPDHLVLAKYMRILTPAFVARFPQRIINIHHSFLPAFIGARPYHQAHARGVKIIGATAHFVTDSLDEGPIIAQDVTHVDHSKNVAAMTRAGHNIETNVLAEALRLVLEDRVFVHGNRTVIFD